MPIQINNSCKLHNEKITKNNKATYLNPCLANKAQDSVSFSGKLPTNPLKKLRIKLQRLAYNHISEARVASLQKHTTRQNKIDRFKLSPSIENVQKYCKVMQGELVAPVKLYSKTKRKSVNGYVVLRKIDPNIGYSQMDSTCQVGKLINKTTQEKIDIAQNGIGKTERILGIPQEKLQATKNTFSIEILDEFGLPVGHSYIDIAPNEVLCKGVINYEPSSYGGVGTILNDTKSLITGMHSSPKVRMITTDSAKQFHFKCGYKINDTQTGTGMGDWLYLPKDSMQKIVEKYKNTELYQGLQNTMKKLGLCSIEQKNIKNNKVGWAFLNNIIGKLKSNTFYQRIN